MGCAVQAKQQHDPPRAHKHLAKLKKHQAWAQSSSSSSSSSSSTGLKQQ
jgi:hypothetical protein